MRDPTILDPAQLRALRRLADIPQQKIAEAIGRSQGYYSSAERGFVRLTPDEQRTIAKLLGIPAVGGR